MVADPLATTVMIAGDYVDRHLKLSFVTVVRTHEAGRRWLEQVRPQLSGVRAEVILVGPGVDADWIIPGHGLVEHAAESALTPELWTRGIVLSKGAAVVLTISDCIPARDWVSAITTGLEQAVDSAAIGGVIDLDPSGGPSDWALYFLRYSAYMPPMSSASVDEIAADNAVYRRAALDRYPEAWQDGFWEPSAHACFRRDGLDIHLDPRIVVRHGHSLSASEFSQQRFIHGRTFGATRYPGQSNASRGFRITAAPATCALMMGRVVARVFSRRRYRTRLIACLPFLAWFIACWVVGESLGYAYGLPMHHSGVSSIPESSGR